MRKHTQDAQAHKAEPTVDQASAHPDGVMYGFTCGCYAVIDEATPFASLPVWNSWMPAKKCGADALSHRVAVKSFRMLGIPENAPYGIARIEFRRGCRDFHAGRSEDGPTTWYVRGRTWAQSRGLGTRASVQAVMDVQRDARKAGFDPSREDEAAFAEIHP